MCMCMLSLVVFLTVACCIVICCAVLRCMRVMGQGRPVPRQVTAEGVVYGKRVKDLSQLANDDELAAEEAAAQGGVPGEHRVYGGSRGCDICVCAVKGAIAATVTAVGACLACLHRALTLAVWGA